eukprot:g1623.t1
MSSKRETEFRRESDADESDGSSIVNDALGKRKAKKDRRKNLIKDAKMRESLEAASHSLLGEKFRSYVRKTGGDIQKEIPQIEVCFKIITVSNVNVVKHSFFAEFILMYDWIDKSVVELFKSFGDSVTVKQLESHILWREHFVPSIEMFNSIEFAYVGGRSLPRIKNAKTGRITVTQRIAGTFRTHFDLRLFPFDSQYLEIQLKTRNVQHVSSDVHSKSAPVVICNPKTWRGKKGHKLESSADWLSEWDFIKIDGAPDGKEQNVYRMQMCILRDSSSKITNLVFPLSTIIICAVTAYGVPVSDLGDRSQIVVTLLLATMTFKFVLSEQLPSAPYQTLMDTYVLQALQLFTVEAISMCIASAMEEYESTIYRYLGLRDFHHTFDASVLVILFVWQVWVHWKLFSVYYSTTPETFRESIESFSVMEKEKSRHTNLLASKLNNRVPLFAGKGMYRPYS